MTGARDFYCCNKRYLTAECDCPNPTSYGEVLTAMRADDAQKKVSTERMSDEHLAVYKAEAQEYDGLTPNACRDVVAEARRARAEEAAERARAEKAEEENAELVKAAKLAVCWAGREIARALREDGLADFHHSLLNVTQALANAIPGDEPCNNPKCDAVHPRCFKDGRWLDDGSEM